MRNKNVGRRRRNILLGISGLDLKGWQMKMLILLISGLAIFLWLDGYHIVWAPTPDQLYGCTVENEAPNGECK